jgi:lysophospholipase L1-like esterase
MILVAVAALAASSQARERTDAPPIEPYKVILVGDSTVAPHSGWGGAFCAQHVKSSVACLNLARGGRSTRSYRQEGSWEAALAEARVPGYRARYVLIQFGHNDQSSRPERWTDRTTEFPANLTRMVEEVRAAGAVPVLVTPLVRRQFKGGTLDNTLASWSDEVRKVATALKVPLVDLNARSAAVVAKLGAVEAMALAQEAPTAAERAAAEKGTTLPPAPTLESEPAPAAAPGAPRGQVTRKFDYTHLGDAGARAIARLVTRDLAAAVPALAGQLVP